MRDVFVLHFRTVVLFFELCLYLISFRPYLRCDFPLIYFSSINVRIIGRLGTESFPILLELIRTLCPLQIVKLLDLDLILRTEVLHELLTLLWLLLFIRLFLRHS